MLTVRAAELGTDMAFSLSTCCENDHNQKRRTLYSKSGTPVNNALLTLTPIENTINAKSISDDSIATKSSYGNHADIQNQTAIKASHTIANILNTAQNTINPICRELREAITKAKELAAARRVNIIGNIIQVDVPAIFTNSTLTDMTEQYLNASIDRFIKITELSVILNNNFSDEECRILIQTNSSGLDQAVDAFLSTDDFNIRTMINNTNFYVDECAVNKAVSIFLFCMGIVNHRIEKAAMITDDTVCNNMLKLLMATTGAIIARERRKSILASKSGKLLCVDPNRGTYEPEGSIAVYGDAYRKWLKEKGGSPEALLGFASSFSRRQDMDYTRENDLLENPEKYVIRYKEKLSELANIATMDDYAIVKDTTRTYISRYIRENNKDTAVVQRLQNNLSLAYEHEYYGEKNLSAYIIKMVCRTFTEGTTIKEFLLTMDNILLHDPETDIPTARNLAVIQVVGKWIASQLVVA